MSGLLFELLKEEGIEDIDEVEDFIFSFNSIEDDNESSLSEIMKTLSAERVSVDTNSVPELIDSVDTGISSLGEIIDNTYDEEEDVVPMLSGLEDTFSDKKVSSVPIDMFFGNDTVVITNNDIIDAEDTAHELSVTEHLDDSVLDTSIDDFINDIDLMTPIFSQDYTPSNGVTDLYALIDYYDYDDSISHAYSNELTAYDYSTEIVENNYPIFNEDARLKCADSVKTLNSVNTCSTISTSEERIIKFKKIYDRLNPKTNLIIPITLSNSNGTFFHSALFTLVDGFVNKPCVDLEDIRKELIRYIGTYTQGIADYNINDANTRSKLSKLLGTLLEEYYNFIQDLNLKQNITTNTIYTYAEIFEALSKNSEDTRDHSKALGLISSILPTRDSTLLTNNVDYPQEEDISSNDSEQLEIFGEESKNSLVIGNSDLLCAAVYNQGVHAKGSYTLLNAIQFVDIARLKEIFTTSNIHIFTDKINIFGGEFTCNCGCVIKYTLSDWLFAITPTEIKSNSINNIVYLKFMANPLSCLHCHSIYMLDLYILNLINNSAYVSSIIDKHSNR